MSPSYIVVQLLHQEPHEYGQAIPFTQVIAHILYQKVRTYGQEMSLSQIIAQLLHVTYTDHSPYVVSRSMYI